MSYAPKTLLDLDAYLRNHGVPTVGIVGDSGHTYGYHLGKDRLPSGDYSASLARDRAGLTNAASAIDIGNHTGLRALTNFLALAGASGAAKDVREVIGPGFDGRAYRWAAENDWDREGPRASGDSHEWHCHVSFYRDSEYRDKITLFEPYIEGDDDMEPSTNVPLSGTSFMRTEPDFATRPTVQDGLLAGTCLTESWGYTERLSRRQIPQVLDELKALRDQLAGHETGDAARDADLRTHLVEQIAPALVAELRTVVGQIPADAVEGAVERVLNRVRLTTSPA